MWYWIQKITGRILFAFQFLGSLTFGIRPRSRIKIRSSVSFLGRLPKFLKCFEYTYVRTPTMLQMEATECGAVALGMILGYFRHHVPLEELRSSCGISRNGSKASHILSAARSYGLTAQGLNVLDCADLKTLEPPFIVFWDFNHFVVVEGWDNTAYYINDPAQGRRKVFKQEFEAAYTGVILYFEPGPEFRSEGRPPSIWSYFKEIIHPIRKEILYIFFLSFLAIVPQFLAAGFIKVFIDDILVHKSEDWLRPLILVIVLTAITQVLLGLLQATHQLRLNISMGVRNATTFLWHILCLPLSFFYNRFVGDIISRAQANERIIHIASQGVAAALSNLVTAVLVWAILFIINPPLTLIAAGGSLAYFGIILWYKSDLASQSFMYQQSYSLFFSHSLNGLRMVEDIQSNASEGSFLKRWGQLYAKNLRLYQNTAVLENKVTILSHITGRLLTIVMLGVGVWMVLNGHLTLGSLLAFQLLLDHANKPIADLMGQLLNIQKLYGDFLRIGDTFRHPPDPILLNKDSSIDVTTPKTLHVEGITFGYAKTDPPQVQQISFSVNPHEHVAIVGATGSGKSTIANLLVGFYHPWEGAIKLDEHSLFNLSAIEKSSLIAVIDTEGQLFDGTVRENLTLGHPHETNLTSNLEVAISDACAEGIVEQLGGLDGVITEGGSNLSQGQRQRLEIARALIRQPQILILDEATSGLDSQTEATILTNLRKRKCALILIAHRLSIIRDSDRIILIQQGKLIASGSHHELIASCPEYVKLMKSEA
ncbi:MAG: cysteine peptidase family C39 domain-containing protein [Alphaproteobacteria bacterium]